MFGFNQMPTKVEKIGYSSMRCQESLSLLG